MYIVQFLYLYHTKHIFFENQISPPKLIFLTLRTWKKGDIEMPLDDTPEERQIQFKAMFP